MSQQSASVQKGRAAYDNDVYGFRVVQSHYQQSDLKTVIFAAHMMSLSKQTQSTEAKKRQHTEPKKKIVIMSSEQLGSLLMLFWVI